MQRIYDNRGEHYPDSPADKWQFKFMYQGQLREIVLYKNNEHFWATVPGGYYSEREGDYRLVPGNIPEDDPEFLEALKCADMFMKKIGRSASPITDSDLKTRLEFEKNHNYRVVDGLDPEQVSNDAAIRCCENCRHEGLHEGYNEEDGLYYDGNGGLKPVKVGGICCEMPKSGVEAHKIHSIAICDLFKSIVKS